MQRQFHYERINQSKNNNVSTGSLNAAVRINSKPNNGCANMRPIIVGIDPDSNKHGVAIYQEQKLIDLRSMRLVDFFGLDCDLKIDEIHIENVCGSNATFSKGFVKNQRAQTTISRSIGMCQQAQIELERVFDMLGLKVVRHPISKSWKDAKSGGKILKQLGWDGKSNEDTRSAAYFGYQGVKAWHTANTISKK